MKHLASNNSSTAVISIRRWIEKLWCTPVIIAGLALIITASYLCGVNNKPVAEDFTRPDVWLELAPDRQFRPAWALLTMAVREVAGSKTDNPQPYLLLTLSMHVLATLALFFFLRQAGHSRVFALTSSLIFGLYPRHHEVVFWPTASPHAYMSLGLVSSLAFYAKWSAQRRPIWMMSSIACYMFALLSCEPAFIGVALLIAYDLVARHVDSRINRRAIIRKLIVGWLPFIFVTCSYYLFLVVNKGGLSAVAGTSGDKSFYNIQLNLRQIRDFFGYISYAAFPFVPLRTDSIVIKSGILIGAFAIFSLCLVFGTRMVRFGAIWVIISVTPYVLLVPFGNADRYFYLASIGFAILFSALLHSTLTFCHHHNLGNHCQLANIAFTALTTAYIAISVYLLQIRGQEWHQAGEMAYNVLNQIYTLYPNLSEHTKIYLLGFPAQYKQARFLGIGTTSAIKEHYASAAPDVYTNEDPLLITAVKNAPTNLFHDPKVLIYIYEEGRVFDYSTSFGSPNVQTLLYR